MKLRTDGLQQNNTFFPRQRTILLILICSFGLLLVSCGDNSTGPGNGGGNGNGEPPEPTFSNIQEIFTDHCGDCHIGSQTNGVRLDSYDNVMDSEGLQYGGSIIVEEEPDNSPLVDKIEANPEFGDRMPEGGPPLSNEQITLIRDWIEEGAQDN